MMTEQQYITVKLFEPVIRDRAATGKTVMDIKRIYEEISGRHLNAYCSVCVGEALDYLSYQLFKYEENITPTQIIIHDDSPKKAGRKK